MVKHTGVRQVVGSAQATHAPTKGHPECGKIGWVAAHAQHRGKRLGHIVSAHATQRLRDAGYNRVYISTDDFRLPAIALYFALGYTPNLYADGTASRWNSVRQQIHETKN